MRVLGQKEGGSRHSLRVSENDYWDYCKGGNEHAWNCLHASCRMTCTAQATKTKSETVSRLCTSRHIIVSLLCGSINQRFAVTCKGDIPFPFQAQNYAVSILYAGRCQNAGD